MTQESTVLGSTKSENGSEVHIPITKRRENDFIVYSRNDGADYWSIIERFRRGELATTPMPARFPHEREIFLVEEYGRRFILKWDKGGWGWGTEGPLEKFFWKLIRGPFYSRLMKRVDRAVRNGCDVVQTIHLVAERRTLHYCHEAYVLMEYAEGETLMSVTGGFEIQYKMNEAEREPYDRRVLEAMTKLHRHDLASCDVNPKNFTLNGSRTTIIDLSCRGNSFIDQVKDAVRLKKTYNIDFPLKGWTRNSLYAILMTFQRVRKRYRKARGKEW